MKLTKRQLELLQKVLLLCLKDGSGHGYDVYGSLMKTAVSLEARGLVSLSAGWPVATTVRITEAGRAALKEMGE